MTLERRSWNTDIESLSILIYTGHEVLSCACQHTYTTTHTQAHYLRWRKNINIIWDTFRNIDSTIYNLQEQAEYSLHVMGKYS
jgi:hypothetical protein